MNRGLTLIILAILVVLGAIVTMVSWQGTLTGPENTPESVKEVPAPPNGSTQQP